MYLLSGLFVFLSAGSRQGASGVRKVQRLACCTGLGVPRPRLLCTPTCSSYHLRHLRSSLAHRGAYWNSKVEMTARRATLGMVGRAVSWVGLRVGCWLLATVLTVASRATTSSLSTVISRLAWSGFCGCDGGRVSLGASSMRVCFRVMECELVAPTNQLRHTPFHASLVCLAVWLSVPPSACCLFSLRCEQHLEVSCRDDCWAAVWLFGCLTFDQLLMSKPNAFCLQSLALKRLIKGAIRLIRNQATTQQLSP